MAKNTITADALENILLRVTEKMTEKFTDAINTMMQQFTKVIGDVVEGKMSALSTRLDTLEASFTDNIGPQMTATSNSVSSKGQTDQRGAVEAASRVLFEFEQEKEEIRKRSRNVVITGLSPVPHTSDIQLVSDFCENNLTVKPHVLSARRIGKDASSTRLCVTLDSSDAAEVLLSSATMLRASSDPDVRRVYFNKDLTRQQAEAAYKLRCAKRNRASQSSPSTSTASAPFSGLQ